MQIRITRNHSLLRNPNHPWTEDLQICGARRKSRKTLTLAVGKIQMGNVNFRKKILCVGRAFFALGILAIGIQHFIVGDFVPVILPSFPSWLPGRACSVWSVGTDLVAPDV